MIGHTKAFAAYRTLSQAHLNFVVLVCYAAPLLRRDLALPNPKVSVAPDHFRGQNPKSEIARYESSYRDELARSTLITVFSYFEAYIKDALEEIVQFHGGKTRWKQSVLKRSTQFISGETSEVKAHKRKLQDRPSPHKFAKYQKYGKLLQSKGFKFPSDLLAHFGASQLLLKLDDKKGMKAWEIPTVLEEGLLFPLSPADRSDFDAVRSIRNKISHGKPHQLALKTSLQYASRLHSLAAKIDSHITEHFLIIEAV
jgi:hypothetical protein